LMVDALIADSLDVGRSLERETAIFTAESVVARPP
jgi:hypothetical protein